MKINPFVCAVVLALYSTFYASAQTDTVFNSVRQESGALEMQRIETPQEQAFGTHVPARWMLKATVGDVISPIIGVANNISISLADRPLVVGAEYKLTPAWSVGGYYGVHFNVLDRQEGEPLVRSGLLRADTRWYYRQPSRVRAGKSANNFSDNYLAAEATAYNSGSSVDGGVNGAFNRFQWSARWGIQRRWLKHGYFDYSLGVGQSAYRFGGTRYNQQWSTDQRFSIGLAQFLPRKQHSQALDACSVLHCFDEQRNMLKINVYNAISGSWSSNFKYLNLQPSVAYEHKIGQTPFSVEGTLGGALNTGTYTVSDPFRWEWLTTTYNAAAELRWYYNQKRHILTGKSGNNLSGAFLALNARHDGLLGNLCYFREYPTDQPNFAGGARVGNSGHVVWGYQQRALKHGYIQFKTGLGIQKNVVYEIGAGGVVSKFDTMIDWSVLGQLQVGFAF